MNPRELTGWATTHLVEVREPPCLLHAHVAAPFQSLRRAACAAGFDLRPQSAFRDFERQLSIWNEKFSGARPLLAADGRRLSAADLTPAERIDAILLWSALPGASRHHWGTDLDLIDASAVPPGHRVELSVPEYSTGGPFAPLRQWLEEHAARFGFFLPYRGLRSGVRAEPWHYSFAPVADAARRGLTVTVLRSVLAEAALLGKEDIMARLGDLHERYVMSIDWP